MVGVLDELPVAVVVVVAVDDDTVDGGVTVVVVVGVTVGATGSVCGDDDDVPSLSPLRSWLSLSSLLPATAKPNSAS